MESTIRTFFFALVFVIAIGFLFYNLFRLYSFMRLAQPERRWDRIFSRLKQTLRIGIFQSKILRDKKAGPIHVGIFWGFLVLLFSASEAVIQGFFACFSWNFLGPFYTAITFSTDIFCIIVMIAVMSALYRRFITKVKRLQGDKAETLDAVIVLSSIFIIIASLLLENTSGLGLQDFHYWAFKPVSSIISSVFPATASTALFDVFWWTHIVAIFAFMNYLPYSKHLHVYTSLFNVFFTNIEPTNKLSKIDFEHESIAKFGVVDVEDFKWKTILDGYSCTHCGRCDSVCPANQTGKVLSPRDIIIKVRSRTLDRGPILIKERKSLKDGDGSGISDIKFNVKEQNILNEKFIGDYENIEGLWQCTTCGACMQECPVAIEHVPAIIEMRRSLVMMESSFPSEVQPAYTNLENNATPWAFSSSERADWAKDVGVNIAAENPIFDVLFWVGCAGSFDDRAKKISVSFSKLMQIAGINFSILGNEEQCTGDPARRTGNEYLADMLIKANVETLSRYNVKKIVTACPHCFNTLKNEYPDFGGKYDVMHHSQFLRDLIKQDRLKIQSYSETEKTAYHDSCYIGRYNNEYDAPREVVNSSIGSKPIDPKRSRDRGFCCGAGGGRMFMEETKGKRVNIERTEELLNTGANEIAVNCPFCMTMITDGVKAKERDDVKVKDIAEILLERVIY